MNEPYVAVFCPSCGVHIDTFDLQDTPEPTLANQRVRYGSVYTCGWCGIQTFDWNHVGRCRQTWPERQALVAKQAALEHMEVRKRLGRMVTDWETGEISEQ